MEGVSIIIPTHGIPEYLKECINSIRNQKIDFNYEILLGVDNCKETLKSIEDDKDFYKEIRLYYFRENVGPFIIKNTLIDLTTYDNILFFDSDDIMVNTMLSDFFNHVKEVDLIRFNYLNFKKNVEQSKPLTAWGVFGVKKSVFDRFTCFEPWKCAADSEFIERVTFHKITTKTVEGVSFHRRLHDKNLTLKPDTNMKSKLREEYKNQIQQKVWTGNWNNPNKVVAQYRKIKL
jgi:glycosyltransferase involved in cell wall biosynthesis